MPTAQNTLNIIDEGNPKKDHHFSRNSEKNDYSG